MPPSSTLPMQYMRMFVSWLQRSRGGGRAMLWLADKRPERVFSLQEALEMTVELNWYVEFIDHCTAGKSAAIFYQFFGPWRIINMKP